MARNQTPRALLQESYRHLMTDPRRAEELASAALELAVSQKNLRDEGSACHALGQALTFLGSYDAALLRLEESYRIFTSLGEGEELGRLHNSIGMIYQRLGETQKALQCYREGVELLRDGDAAVIGKLRCNIALILSNLGDYQEASQIFLDLLPYYEEHDEPQAWIILDNLGSIYSELGEYEQGIRAFSRSLERSYASGNLYGQAMTLGNLGALYNEAGEHRKALAHLTEALDICERIEDRDGLTRTLHNIGVCHELQGNYREALRYLRRSAKEALAIGNIRSSAYTGAAIGSVLLKTGRPADAVRRLQRAARTARQVEDASLEYNIYAELSLAHEAAGDLAEALACHRRYSEMRERIQGEETKRRIAEMQMRFDLERAEKEKEIYRLRSEQLEKDLRIKTGELTAMALRLVQRSEMLDSVKDGLAEVLSAQNGSAHPTLRTVLHTVEGSARAEGEWEAFQQQFHRVHPDYIRVLSARFPVLSPTELKICALLKINLNSKEIARLLHVSIRDIENHRYRIRKKLGLASGDNLGSFLAGV